MFVCLCLTSHQQLRSYADEATDWSLIWQTGEAGDQPATPDIQSKWFIHNTTVVLTLCMLDMPNGLDPDQDRRSVGSDLGPNCLQSISANDKIYH